MSYSKASNKIRAKRASEWRPVLVSFRVEMVKRQSKYNSANDEMEEEEEEEYCMFV